MIAVSDTSPICYLVLIGEIELLPALFTQVVIPPAVATELSHPGAPGAVSRWWAAPPAWLRVAGSSGAPLRRELQALHSGEREAIALAQHLPADLLLVDDKAARAAAKSLGLPVMGLLGVLGIAAEQGRVDVPGAVERLQRTNFRVSANLLRELLARYPRRD